jgi:hypothetical protein
MIIIEPNTIIEWMGLIFIIFAIFTLGVAFTRIADNIINYLS